PRDDLLSALDNWVVNRAAPDEIVATKYVNDDPTQGVAFQRPLCVFPKVSTYKGGSTTAASSFRCVGQGQHPGNATLSPNAGRTRQRGADPTRRGHFARGVSAQIGSP